MNPALVTEARLREAFDSERSFSAGADYFRRGRVLSLSAGAGDRRHTVTSEVEGSHSQVYDQSITIDRNGRGGLTVIGYCTCPVGYNCKHVAAALLEWSSGAAEAEADPYRASPEVEAWLKRVKTVAARHEALEPGSVKNAIAYVIAVPDKGPVSLNPWVYKLDRYGKRIDPPKIVDLHQAMGNSPPKYVRAVDRDILSGLVHTTGWGPNARYALAKPTGGRTLAALVASGRCHVGGVSGPLLSGGEARAATADWRIDETGMQAFSLSVEGGGAVLPLSPPHYFDAAAAVCGPLVTELPEPLLETLMEAPPIPPGLVEDVKASLGPAVANLRAQVPLPRDIDGYATRRAPPRPVARLLVAKVDRIKPDALRYNHWGPKPVDKVEAPVMSLAFDYGGVRFAYQDPRPHGVVVEDGGPVVRIARDKPAEARLFARLAKYGLRDLKSFRPFAVDANAGWLALDPDAPPESFATFLATARPVLEREGWTIDTAEFPFRLAEVEEAGWSVDLRPAKEAAGGADWFDLELGARIDGERLDLTPALLRLLNLLPREGRAEALRTHLAQREAVGQVEVRLDDGRFALLPLSRVAPILEGLLALWGQESEAPGRVSVFDAEAVDELKDRLGGAVVWSGGERLERLALELRGWADRAPTPLPPAFGASLRPYQQTGLDWLQMLARAGFGGLLADDMGLGKTIQALAHIAVEKAAGRLVRPALIVAPTSVLPNWIAEAKRFTPDLRCLVSRGVDRASAFETFGDQDLIVTSYPLLARDREVLEARRWSLVILDEGQTIRNPATAAAKAAFALEADQRLILSGTPVENHLGDVWSLMTFLNPGLLGDYKTFTRRFRAPIEKHRDKAVEARLRARVRPFLLRRTKAEVAADLPGKTEIAETVDLNATQADLYEATRLIMSARVRDVLAKKGLARSSIVVLDALLKLRQVCCDPRLVASASAKAKAGGSAKLDRLFELLDQLREEGRKALLFSQFTSMLKLIAEALDARGVDYAWLTGDTADRAEPVRRFQSGEVDLFLISLKAGGSGLNLTEADTVILYDPWWNPAVEAQAIDRAHRIGQAKPVFVHRLITAGTVEEKMLALQSRKKELAAALWSEDAAALGALTETDLSALFGPLGR